MKKLFAMILILDLISGFALGFEASHYAVGTQLEFVTPHIWQNIDKKYSDGLIS